MRGRFIEKWVLDGRTGQKNLEVDEVRSEYPLVETASAYGFRYISGAGSGLLLMSVPSQTWYKPRLLIIDNATTPANIVRFYIVGSAAAASATIMAFHIGGSQTEVIDLKGITVDKDIYVSNLVSNLMVRMGGLLIASGPI